MPDTLSTILDEAVEATVRRTHEAACAKEIAIGYAVYSNAAKATALGVPRALIVDEGAVSRAVAIAMAEGALARSERTSLSRSRASRGRPARGTRKGSSISPARAAEARRRTRKRTMGRSDGCACGSNA